MSNPRVRTWLPFWAAMLLAAVFLISGCIVHRNRPRTRHHRHSRCPPGKVLVQGKHGKWKCKKPKKRKKHKKHKKHKRH